MTLDPSFEFNPNMESQSRERQATLVENCENNQTVWSLILGEGTGRSGETVMNGISRSPTAVPPAATLQSSLRSTARTSGAAMPEIRVSNEFQRISLSATGDVVADDSSGSSLLGGVSHWWIYFTIVLIGIRRSQRRL